MCVEILIDRLSQREETTLCTLFSADNTFQLVYHPLDYKAELILQNETSLLCCIEFLMAHHKNKRSQSDTRVG